MFFCHIEFRFDTLFSFPSLMNRILRSLPLPINKHLLLTDLKNLMLAKNRLKLGHFVDTMCVSDMESAKINEMFDKSIFKLHSQN